MRTMTAGRPADADDIHSYEDIVAAHRDLCTKVAGGKGATYAKAAERVAELGRLYRKRATLTDEIRHTAQTALAAIRQAVRTHKSADLERFNIADAWLDHLSLLVNAPPDER